MKKIKILCLTYGKSSELARHALDKIVDEDMEIELLDGLAEELGHDIEEKIEGGASIIVAGGENGEYAKAHFDLPVAEIEISSFDYAKALVFAKTLGAKICVVKYKDDNFYDFKKISELVGVTFDLILYEDTFDMEQQIKALEPQVIIGGGSANKLADDLGYVSILIYPGEEAILNAVHKSKKFFLELKQQQEKTHLLNTLLQAVPNAVIIINEQGNITEFNSEAEHFFNIFLKSAKNKNIGELLPESKLEQALCPGFARTATVKPMGDKMFLDTQIQLKVGATIIGAMSLIAKMGDITEAQLEYQLREAKKNQIKGFAAKSRFEDIVGHSKGLLKTISDAKIYAKSDSSVLITGETGCGKELFAQSIHNFSGRSQQPFIAINCAALPENLLESELFGYEEGAFTGSRKGGKMGIFELAGNGTIFLDEIGELPITLQARLLRVLQEKEVLRVGGDRLYQVHARIISATNRDINKLSGQNFRRDLFYRLNVLEIKIPPLRERREDILLLFQYFLDTKSHFADRAIPIPETVTELLKRYSWPGNIRELQNVSERFLLFVGQSKRLDDKVAFKHIIDAIGSGQLISDILQQYGYLDVSTISGKDLKPIFQDLKTLLSLSNETLAKELGISRTTAWRMQQGDPR